MQPRLFSDVVSGSGQKHLLVGDAFLERYDLGGDLGWIYDKLIPLDEDYFHQLAVHRSELALERIIEQTTPLALLTVRNKVVREAAVKRLVRDTYPDVLAFIDKFDTYHSPTLMPMVEIMSARVLELNIKREQGFELLELRDSSRSALDEALKLYREDIPETFYITFSEDRDIEAFRMLTRSADLRNYDGTSARRAGDRRAFGSKLVYSLKNYDWRPGKYPRPEGQWHWKGQPLEEVEGDLYMFADDYLTLEPDDRICELMRSNGSIAAVHVVLRDETLVSLPNRNALEDNKLRLRDLADGFNRIDEEDHLEPSVVIQEESLALGGAK